MSTLLYDSADAQVWHASHLDLAAAMAGLCANALVVDCPYSALTHAGHGSGTTIANAARAARASSKAARRRARWEASRGTRRSINYQPWTAADVEAFVRTWHPLCAGWFVSITDDVLAPTWRAALRAAGRKTFAPLPFVDRGSRVRIQGDGPSGWSAFVVVGRPMDGAWLTEWRRRRRARGLSPTLRGDYVVPDGEHERYEVVGGKPLWLMRALLDDYSEPGDLVVDPCCGAGPTGAAARQTGRRSICGDLDADRAALAAKNVAATREQTTMLRALEAPVEQLALPEAMS